MNSLIIIPIFIAFGIMVFSTLQMRSKNQVIEEEVVIEDELPDFMFMLDPDLDESRRLRRG